MAVNLARWRPRTTSRLGTAGSVRQESAEGVCRSVGGVLIRTNRRVMRFWIMLLSRSRAPGAVSARWVPTQAGECQTIHPGEPVVPVGSLALTHLAPPQAVELLSWSAVGRDLCQCDDAMALGCQVAATSAGLAAAYPRRDQ